MKPRKGSARPKVFFAGTLAAARRAARGHAGALCASPRSPAALRRALVESLPVRAVIERERPGSRNRTVRRFLLPPAPSLLHHAISGIARHEEEEAHEGVAGRLGPSRAHWIEGDLTDRRARTLLAELDGPRLWIVEDFRRLKLSAGIWSRLDERKIWLAAFRALAWRPANARNPFVRK